MHAPDGPANGFNIGRMLADEEIEVWPENWPAWILFCEVGTQWRVGMSGAIGLDYNVLFARMDRHGLSHDDWENRFDDIRHLEAAALTQMHES